LNYQQITLTVIVREDEAEEVERELNQNLDVLGEEYTLHHERVEVEDCEEPEDESLLDSFEDVA
jgi:hypothetical protein